MPDHFGNIVGKEAVFNRRIGRGFKGSRFDYMAIALGVLLVLSNLLDVSWRAVDSTLHEDQCVGMIDPFLLPDHPDVSIPTELAEIVPEMTCSPTCQVKIIPSSCRMAKTWYIETIDCEGNKKAVGGDEFYISIQLMGPSPQIATAWVSDLANGLYQLDFQCAPLSDHGCAGFHDSNSTETSVQLTVNQQYTCGMGALNPPVKTLWKTGGNVVRKHNHSFTSLGVHSLPTIRPFNPPVYRPNLLEYDMLFPFGDSLMQQFLEPQGISLPNSGKPLTMDSLRRWKRELDAKFGKQMTHNDIGTKKRAALIIGSAVWDLLADGSKGDGAWSLPSHEEAWRDLIQHIQVTYPKVEIFWKSPTAIHVHVPMLHVQSSDAGELEKFFGKERFYQRLRYMSASRSFELYRAQKELCQNANISFLDVYGATYLQADETRLGDGRHFTPRLNLYTSDWFFQKSSERMEH